MGRLTKLLVFSLIVALAIPLVSGCGGAKKPKKKESAPRLKTDHAKAGPKQAFPDEAEPKDEVDPAVAKLNKLMAMLDSESAAKRKSALNQLAAMKDQDLVKPALKPIRKCVRC